VIDTKSATYRTAQSRAWRERNPERALVNRLRDAAKRIGVDPDELLASYEAHCKRCDICGRTADEVGHKRAFRLIPDHDHTTGNYVAGYVLIAIAP
jgi:hypothetical protein